jgi:hypothetical protein
MPRRAYDGCGLRKPTERGVYLPWVWFSNARGFAAEKRRSQKRKYSDDPYLLQLEAVVTLIWEQGISDEHELAAMYLHDPVRY